MQVIIPQQMGHSIMTGESHQSSPSPEYNSIMIMISYTFVLYTKLDKEQIDQIEI